MAELGDDAKTWHQWAGRMARLMGIDQLLTIGELSAEAAASFGKEAEHFEDDSELVSALLPRLDAGVTVLVKGSRCMAMENIVSQLA